MRCAPATTITEVTRIITSIECEKFRLREAKELQMLADTNLEFPDVVGQVRFVQGPELDDPKSTLRLIVPLMVEQDVTVYLCLWEESASTFRQHLGAVKDSNCVMVITMVNPKKFGNNLYLNSTRGTKLYFGEEMNAVKNFCTRLGITGTHHFSKADTSVHIRKKEIISITELHNFIANSNELTQDAEFLCEAVLLILQTQAGGVTYHAVYAVVNFTNHLTKHGKH